MLKNISLYLVTDKKMAGKMSLSDIVNTAVKAGVDAVQIREKEMSSREFVQLGSELMKTLKGTRIPLIVNDRIDIAQIIKADGVHLGQSDISVIEARKILGKNKIIGLTLDKLNEFNPKESKVIDYIGLSTIFPTETKFDVKNIWKKSEILKLKKLFPGPLIGIGGISKHNVQKALTFGIDGVAVVSAICSQKNLNEIKKATTELRFLIDKYKEKK